ncbi:sulfotransferase domain-containing protein [Spongiibacter tropicus]|uniref:sulfotransferase domain-containing protein n=1 Tax=Spongiibacter tropicus TaxID=454602 RepID=UPI0035BE8EDC
MNFNSNIVLKKSRKWSVDLARPLISGSPPRVLINSIPKSGTHLLLQYMTSLGFSDYGGFLASTPSFTMRRQSDEKIIKKLSGVLRREVCSSHIFHSSAVEEFLSLSQLPMVFVYRDPRAIFLSEINYLSTMNRWHRCHKFYKSAESFEEKFRLCLDGIEHESILYPRFKERISPYLGWLNSKYTFTIKFEDMIASPGNSYENIAEYLRTYPGMDDITRSKLKIDSRRSHTYTGLAADRWKNELTDFQLALLNDEVSDFLKIMGYQDAL